MPVKENCSCQYCVEYDSLLTKINNIKSVRDQITSLSTNFDTIHNALPNLKSNTRAFMKTDTMGELCTCIESLDSDLVACKNNMKSTIAKELTLLLNQAHTTKENAIQYHWEQDNEE